MLSNAESQGGSSKGIASMGGARREDAPTARTSQWNPPLPSFSTWRLGRWGLPSGPIGLPGILKLLGCSCAIPMGLPWMRGIGLHPNCSPARLCELCEGKRETPVDLRCWTFLVPNICASHSPLGNLTPQIQFEGTCTCASLASKEVRDSLSID